MPALNRFVFLCIAERQAICTAILSQLGHDFELVTHPREVVRLCVEGDVAGVLLDTISSVRVGIHEMAAVYDMGINIPVLRVSGWEAGVPIAMCNAPFRKGPLEQSLREIVSGDPSWNHPTYLRRTLRVPLPTRIEIRDDAEEIKGYGINASVTGTFVLTWDSPRLGEIVTVRFLDLPFSFETKARVCRSTPWDAAKKIPGCGLAFLEKPPEDFRHMIADIHFRRIAGMSTECAGAEFLDPEAVFPIHIA